MKPTRSKYTNACCEIIISPLTITGYWDAYHRGNFSTYVGVGVGACFIKEDLIISAYSQTASVSESLIGFEVHTTGGFRFAPFRSILRSPFQAVR